VGIVGNTENLGLEALGVKIDRTHVVTDEYCRTGVEGLYAIGDIAGAPWLAHKASHEGVMVAELIAGGIRTRSSRGQSPAAPIATRRSPVSA
jgi:dihydrolipoamide dehydrogenase